MALLSHPFRILPSGAAAVHEDGTEEYLAERIALILATGAGERPLVPEFGLGDLAYEQLMTPALAVQAELFELPVDIISVTETVNPNESRQYLVEFDVQTGEF